ncbi:MAG: acetyltransferase [Acidimicrobiaceae bacterium]|nr:acetyltransferase [Acidimicrobiaceae bacterium]
MTGETDLARMLATLDVARRPGRFAFVTGEWPTLAPDAAATIHEDEGPTYVVTVEQAAEAGAPIDFEAAWLTLTVHSSLEAVGLTAAFSAALGAAGIPCNVLAGYHHDHLLVPADRADDATMVLRSLGG